ncbi:DUF4232 domain-containing protein [Streptomyces sp. NPDC001530]|uniref:DUF4232 domain-containing protein n=1 Tax=Streptomyces sp. NPDC001530 TaxID=3364582 RepID=UPI00368269EC
MRAIPLAAAALTAALVLTACDDGGDGGGGKSDQSRESTACSINQLGIHVGPANAAPAAGDSGNIPVTLTNTNSRTCTLDGFPGIEMQAGGTSWTLAPEKGSTAQKLSLKKDETATFTITYVRGEAGAKGAAVTTMKISLPGHTEAEGWKWTYGTVARKAADELNASVSSFRTAGD